MEERLAGGRLTEGVVRTGDTVRRPSHEASAFVASLLTHLAVDSAVCAIDREQGGRESLAAEALRLRAALTRRDLESSLQA